MLQRYFWKLLPKVQRNFLLSRLPVQERQIVNKAMSGNAHFPAYFRERRCLFVHVPKCAGSSLCAALFDGGRPDDPVFEGVLERTLRRETDRVVRTFAERLAAGRRERERVAQGLESLGAPRQRGKCDFCGRTAVWVTNMTTSLKLTDAHNGLRVIRRDAAERIEIKQDRMAHATEIVLELGRTGLPWREYPVELLYTDYSKAKGQSVLNSVNILVDLVVR